MKKNSITLNVLSDITAKMKNINNYSAEKRALIVITGSNTDVIRKMREINYLREKGYELDLAFSFMSERILDTEKIILEIKPRNIYREEDIFDLEDILKQYSCLIGPNITMNTISKISSGMIDSFISTIIWSFLYDSKEVYLDYSNIRQFLGRKTENKKMESMINNNINILEEMGVKEITLGSYIDKIYKEKKDPGIEINNKKNPISKNRVITGSDLEKLSKNEVLTVYKGDIITPLAVDMAKDMGIIIERK